MSDADAIRRNTATHRRGVLRTAAQVWTEDPKKRRAEVVDACRDAGVTWPELAVALDYSNKGEPDQYDTDDARKAGQALERWYTRHRHLLNVVDS